MSEHDPSDPSKPKATSITTRENTHLTTRDNTAAGRPGSRLTEAQTTELVKTGARLLQDVASIARDLVEIQKIREQANADERRIEAKTRKIVMAIHAEIERTRVDHDGLRARGDVIALLVREISTALNSMPEVDNACRKALVDTLPRLAELAVSEPGAGPAPR